ncbi:MAG: hypothetical protein IPI85_05140 [Dehalococcoidia bacterium]|nr:hypothetical protein [Dehalococcoidia bacterium]
MEPGWEVRSKDVLLKDEQGKSMLTPDGRPRSERVEVSRTRVRVNRITALQNDLALALAAPSLRIEAPVPGWRSWGAKCRTTRLRSWACGQLWKPESSPNLPRRANSLWHSARASPGYLWLRTSRRCPTC